MLCPPLINMRSTLLSERSCPIFEINEPTVGLLPMVMTLSRAGAIKQISYPNYFILSESVDAPNEMKQRSLGISSYRGQGANDRGYPRKRDKEKWTFILTGPVRLRRLHSIDSRCVTVTRGTELKVTLWQSKSMATIKFWRVRSMYCTYCP